MIITISGKAGSGKSTTAKEVAKRLGLKHYSIGDLMRQIAKDKGISLMDLSKEAENDNSIDEELDKKQIQLRKKDDFVIDGRLTAFFIPNATLKVFLDCNEQTRAERILKEGRKDESAKSIEDLMEKIRQRELSEKKRYKEIYNIDYTDKKMYNIIIDTTGLSREEVIEGVINQVKTKAKKEK